jgi:processive 1,2-diacylglycerol beta-glucosyltransferase
MAYKPDLIVCTHFTPAVLVAYLFERDELNVPPAIVVTDFDCHAMWLSRIFQHYFVAIEETKVHLEALGLPSNRITVSGIPIDPVFSESVDRTAVRKSFGLQPDLPTVLLSAGAIGGAPVELIVQRLEEGLRQEVQTIVVCGRNAELREKVLKQVGGNPRFCVLGFTDRMAELMKISDLFIGKPGGLTTSELLACGLPLAIIQPIPGQEERNSDHLLEEGIAIKCNELTTLAYKVDRLLGDPPRLAAMRRHALALGRPHAARTVVETLLADDLPAHILNEEQREAMTLIAAPET